MDVEQLTPTDESTTRDEFYRWARQRAEMLQGLYIHILVYLVVNAGLFAINYFTRGDDGGWWFYWPLLVWGIGLGIHVLVTVAPVFSEEWVDRRARRIAAKRL